jgi:hypothetical protein
VSAFTSYYFDVRDFENLFPSKYYQFPRSIKNAEEFLIQMKVLEIVFQKDSERIMPFDLKRLARIILAFYHFPTMLDSR